MLSTAFRIPSVANFVTQISLNKCADALEAGYQISTLAFVDSQSIEIRKVEQKKDRLCPKAGKSKYVARLNWS